MRVRSQWIGWVAAAAIVVVALPLLAAPQETDQEPEETGLSGLEPLGVPTEPIDEILQSEEQMILGEGYFYDPGERRDPFRSLLASRSRPLLRGPRPEGIPGLLIDEINLTGIFVLGEGPIAQVQSSDREESYLLRAGDQLFDGEVLTIGSADVTFRQIVNDPTSIKPFREVVKKLDS